MEDLFGRPVPDPSPGSEAAEDARVYEEWRRLYPDRAARADQITEEIRELIREKEEVLAWPDELGSVSG